ncbi:serine-protein kinase ATM isoform X2 [Frieseomelitta varia]|uniref:serine-protein kinase ATM isoform X2 n=1 Tax=Frieseomelitta varia TaxID=561572 RepID=UPI001CB6AFE2|nr:serine-protein kinase ATM isoform X2 [Frieseomelitta varia]
MSRYLERIQTILKNADSKKITDKRKCVVDLLELYDNEEAILEICKNTERNERKESIIDWSYIIHIVHRILLNETDRLANKDTCNKTIVNERNKTCILIQKTFQYANCYKVPLLKCKDIMPLVLQILGTNIFEHYHDIYINMLISYILPFRIYQVNMIPKHWEELLKICINLYKRMSSLTSKRAVLNALQMIIEYGCLYSNLSLNVEEILLFLESILLDVKLNEEILAESGYKLTNIICQQIAIEYRITLCHFSENILPNIISLKGSTEKYKLLLFFVKIHHPKGVHTICNGAYSYDWNKWHIILKSMYLMILKDLKADILIKSFLWLAAEVFKQIIENPNLIIEEKLFNEYDYIQPVKRRRIAAKISGPVDILIDNNPEEAWPMIQILTILLKRHPECLKSEDYPTFLKILVNLFTLSRKEENIMNNLYELAAVLLVSEKIYSIIDIENSNIYWDQIWDILLRSLNINQNEISTHKLTQLFIIHNKITNPNALLKLYLTNVIKWSIMSVRTLIVVCEHLPLPTDMTVFNTNVYSPAIDTNSVRSCLIKWILNIPWHKMATQIKIDELCLLLISITLKSKHQKQIKFSELNDINNLCDCLKNEQNTDTFCEHIEQYYLLLTYKKNIFSEESKEKNSEEKPKVNEHVLFMEDIVTYLMNSLHIIIENESGNDDLHIVIIKITIIGKVISMMKELNMVPKNIEELSLVQALKNYINFAYSSLEKLNSRSKYAYLLNVTKVLNILYETSYDADVAEIIVTSTTLDMLKNIFNLMNIEDNEIRRKYLDREVIQNQCDFCNNGTIRIQTTKALTLFCCINVEQKRSEIQVKLMNNLLKTDMYDLSHTVDSAMAITVLKSLLKYDKEELWQNHEELPLKNLLKLYRKCYKDETVMRYILNIFPYFFNYAIVYNYQLDDLMNIIVQFNKLRSERRYGFLAHKEFVKCLSEIIYISPSHFYYTDTLNQMPIIEGILSSLNSPSFLVQVQIIKCIQKIYSSKNINFENKKILFTEIEKSIDKLIINNENNDKIKIDKKKVITASVSLMLAAIISTNGTFQCHALLTMLRFTIDKKVESQIISRSIDIMSNQMNYLDIMDENLSYLMTYWFNSKYSLHLFPWNLTRCKSEEQFYKTHSNIIALIKFQNLEISNVVSFCNSINLSFEETIENIFPQILSWLLYCISGNNENVSEELACKVFKKLISNENEFARTKKFSNLFRDKFEKILIFLIERLHDEDYLEEILGERISFAISDPPHFKKEIIITCLKYMEENFLIQKNSIQYVLVCNYPSILQKILLHLINNVYKREFEEHKIKAFHQYLFFCTLIIKELKQEYFNTLSMYIIKDVGYNLLHIIKLHDSILRKLACKYFYEFVTHILHVRSEQIKEILNFTVMTLTPIAQTEKMPITLEILKFLIIDQKEILCDAIEKLNSFPNVPIFLEIRKVHNDLKYKANKIYSLEQEIQHFLCTVADRDIHYSIEDITHLQIQLSTRKEELRELYDKLETFHGFSEDCTLSILHQLIYKLIKLTASSDINVSIEAVKCLGELGPTDLTSMIYFEKSHVKESSDLIEILSYKIITIMVQFLFQSDIEFRKISADILHVIFSSSWGQKLLNTKYMEHLKTVLNESQSILPLCYIQPFINNKHSKMSNIGVNYTKVYDIITPDNIIWTIQSDGSYTTWIVELTCSVLKCFTGFYSENLIPICTLSTEFCEIILPRIIFLILYIDKHFMSSICLCINKIFEYHFNFTNNLETSISSQKFTYCDHRIVRCMLNIVNYIRMQVSNNVLKLNYIYIAKAAKYCSAFFTAILYAEMSCETILNDYNKFQTSKIDYVYEISPEEGKVIQNILRDSYAKIGDFDAIDGTGSSHLQDHSSRIRHYVHTNKWDKVMLAQDVELSSGNMTVIKEMANGLYQSGLQYLLSNFISTMSNNGAKIDEDIQYECAWRLSNWNICETNQSLYTQSNCNLKLEITEHDYHFYHYQALKYFHEGNKTGIQDAIQNARTSIIKALRNISLESSKTIYEKLMHLQLINEIEELNFAKQDEYDKLLYKWQQQDVVNFNEFEYIEPILTQRTVMFQINNTLTNNEDIKSALFNTYLQISKIAADKDNLHCATRSLAILTKQKDIPSKIQDQLLYQESLLARLTKDLDIGRFLLRNLMQKKSLDASLRAQILRVYGDWMAETKSENPQIIIQNYYLKSIEINTLINTQDTETIKDLHDTQVALARFADNQFQQISSYINSPQFEHLKECVTYSGKGINVPSINEDKYIRSAMILNQRQNTNDVAELEHIQKERDNYLILALKYYLIVLQQSENYNLLIFRIIALWLDNIYQKEINDLLQENLNRIPSFKFIPLVPQLAAHMNDNFNEFSEKIYKIMQRCALEHPHHTLPVLLALKNLHGDYEYNTVKKNRILEPRVLGAQKLLQELTESNIISIIQEMEKLSHALVMLANLATTSSKCCTIKIPKNQNILKIKNFENIFVLTLTIDVRPLRNYNNVIGIAKYTESYETVGGINTPKKLTCIGTDGIHRYQLIKGKDDLRQDAVMQQVFNVMNTLLKSYKETKRRKLTIRTYKVVPLTQRSGILEWCNNTMPIITILIGSNTFPGLCKKYYPKDYTANNCKEKLAAVVKSSTDMKLKVFMDCCAHMHPVMHHFFSEKYLSPETWFERRLAYTRSIATTSMAGYILGLGDRHLSNILIDQTTAEVIHIDFGIAFEQGKVLPIPETIPFRLTRNIEVGMGVSGVEGTMRHCCEKTLTVLRDQRQIIITLLQVLIYDPLFKWTITPAKAHDIQSGTSSRLVENNQCVRAINKTAERALLRIEQKLQGTEEGLASSVSGQVERLIQEAHDPINLCRLYCGWQPYL